MTERRVFHLNDEAIKRRAVAYIAELPAGTGMCVDVKPRTRSLDQSAKFHAMCADIAASGLTWAGKRRSAAEWKVLLVSGHSVATKEGSDVVPGLEGEFINLRESTATMSKARSSSLIEYTAAFMAANNISQFESEPA